MVVFLEHTRKRQASPATHWFSIRGGLLLATHQRNEIDASTDTGILDINCTTEIIENQTSPHSCEGY